MISAIYVEEEVREHPRTRVILARFPNADVIRIGRYGEVFNRGAQNFRLQKARPALILASKHGRRVLEAPTDYGIGRQQNYYFSHMLNCVYDCRYCFLQGRYRSAHYVLFVNYEDFSTEIRTRATPGACFFSGYDCDSLALEPVTGFAAFFLDTFATLPAWMELRTKSTQVRGLLEREPLENVIVAFSFTPEEIARRLEDRVPSVARRIDAMRRLAQHGWPVGVRFDPLILSRDFEERYQRLFATVFAAVPGERMHSVSLGAFRLPADYWQRALRLHPDSPLFAAAVETRGGVVSYPREDEATALARCRSMLQPYVDGKRVYALSLETS